jgi:hypothetical protein
MKSRLLAFLGVIALLGGAAVVVLATLGANDSSSTEKSRPPRTTPAATPPRRPPPPPPARPAARPVRPVKLAGIRAFDPEGDKAENDDLAPDATDGDLATSWRTERYRSFFKKGVGLVLDARRPVRLSRVVVRTDTPGFSAEIQAGPSPGGPFTAVSAVRQVNGTTAFPLRMAAPARYVVVWVVDLPDNSAAEVNEVTAFGRQTAPAAAD